MHKDKQWWDCRTKLDPETGCIEWQRAKTTDGYGQSGQRKYQSETLMHRLSWRDAGGVIPDGLYVLHHCDNPSCVNVDHLYVGTAKQNSVDREQRNRGRCSRGENSGTARLQYADVQDIRLSSLPASVWARRYGVSKSTINRARSGKSWKHVEPCP